MEVQYIIISGNRCVGKRNEIPRLNELYEKMKGGPNFLEANDYNGMGIYDERTTKY